MTREPVTPDDLIAAGIAVRDALVKLSPEQWQEMPPKMTWTRHVTGMHIAHVSNVYAVDLAAGEPRQFLLLPIDETAGDSAEIPELVRLNTNLLAVVARAVPSGTRGWYPNSLPDAEGFIAMACTEALLHCWDVMNGTDFQFAGDEEVSGRLLDRLFPWCPSDTSRWQTLLFVTGRAELEGYDSPGERWMWHADPMSEWDGTEPRSDIWVGGD